MINLRDKGAEFWDRSNRPVRVLTVFVMLAAIAALPYASNSFLQTPIAAFDAVLVYPMGIFILMAMGLNVVVGKSGLLDLGYVAFFAVGAYTMALLGTHTGLNLSLIHISEPTRPY